MINLDMLTQDHAPTRKTKIAVTIGPSCSDPEVLERMVDAGMDLARFKFSHGTPQANAEVLTTLRKVWMCGHSFGVNMFSTLCGRHPLCSGTFQCPGGLLTPPHPPCSGCADGPAVLLLRSPPNGLTLLPLLLLLHTQLCASKGRTVAVLMDLQGPEVRTSYLIDRATKARIDKLELKTGERVSLYGTNDLSEVSGTIWYQ